VQTDTVSTFKDFTVPKMSLERWYHLVVTRNNGTTKVYLNGEESSSGGQTQIPDLTIDQIGRYTNGASGFWYNGMLDEVKIYNYKITLDEIRENYNQGIQNVLSKTQDDKQFDGLVGWWKMDEPSWSGNTDEVIDYSGAGNHGTATNANSTTTAKFGRAGEFNATDEYITLTNGSSFSNLNTSDFTVAGWFRTSDNTKNWQGILTTSNSVHFMFIYIHPNRIYSYFYLDGDAGNIQVLYSPSGGIANNTWYHFAYTREMDTGVSKLYLDGEEINSLVAVGNTGNAQSALYISDNSTNNFDGALDDMRIYKRALSGGEVRGLYELAPAPVGYWKMDEMSGTTVVDSSGHGNDTAFGGAPTWQARGKTGSALDFDGTDDEVTISYANQNGLDVNQGSISAWIYWTGTSGWDNIVAMTNGSVSGYKLGVNSSNNAVTFFCLNPLGASGAYAINFSDPSSLPREEWHHVAVTFEYATGTTARLYVDGVEVNNYTSVAACLKPTSGAFDIGHSSTTGLGSGYWQGKIDDLKIFNYPMTARQVALEYDGGGPVGYWKFDKGEGETAYDYSGNSNDGTVFVGTGGSNTATTTMWTNGATGKINGSLDFDGTDDYVGVSSGYSFDDKTEISISTWVKVNGGDNDYIIELPESGGGGNGPGIHYISGNIDYHIVTHSDNSFTDVNFTPVIGTWYHVLLTYDGVTLKGYKNGEFIGSHDVTLGTGIKHATGETNIGRFGSAGFYSDAQIDEVKIYNYALTPEEVRRDFNGGFATNFK